MMLWVMIIINKNSTGHNADKLAEHTKQQVQQYYKAYLTAVGVIPTDPEEKAQQKLFIRNKMIKTGTPVRGIEYNTTAAFV